MNYTQFHATYVTTQWFLMMSKMVQEEILGIDIYELVFDENIKIVEQLLKKYTDEQQLEIGRRINKMRMTAYERLSQTNNERRYQKTRRDIKVMEHLLNILIKDRLKDYQME